MNRDDVLGEVLEKGQSTVQKTGKAVTGAAVNAVKAVTGQVTGSDVSGQQMEANASPQDQASQADAQAQVNDMVKDLYAPSSPQDGQPALSKEQIEEADKAKLEQVKQQLHNEVYYQPLINKAQSQGEEERPAEKVEREEIQELQEERNKEKKKPDYALQREQRRAEVKGGIAG